MKNEMPKLKAGMVVESSSCSERLFVMETIKNELFGMSNGEPWASGIDNEKVNKIWIINTPFKLLSDTNLKYYADLIWEREPKTDWSKVAVDTKILVRNSTNVWIKSHFAKFNDGIIYAFDHGKSSFTGTELYAWKHTMLYEGNEGLL